MFDPSTFGQDDPDSLLGGFRAPRRFIGWQTFFDFGDGEVKPNKKIDTKMSTPLFNLPLSTLPNDRGEDIGPTSLASRNLLRHITWSIPSGQRIANLMGEPSLLAADLPELGALGADLDVSTPLFYYILKEAELAADGDHLGPVAAASSPKSSSASSSSTPTRTCRPTPTGAPRSRWPTPPLATA